MKITIRRVLGAGGIAALLLGLLAWLLWPDPPKKPVRVAAVTAPKPAPVEAPPEPSMPSLVEAREPGDVLEKLGIDPKVTPHCAVINQWWARRVPEWVITDNMEGQAMLFNIKELECLTASPVPPGVLLWAENHEAWSEDRAKR